MFSSPPAVTHHTELNSLFQLRRLWQSWDPLSAPTYTVSQLKKFRKLFLIDKHAAPSRSFAASTDLDVYGQQVRAEQDAETRRKQAERQMSPYETLMWTVWLPKIRSSIKSVACDTRLPLETRSLTGLSIAQQRLVAEQPSSSGAALHVLASLTPRVCPRQHPRPAHPPEGLVSYRRVVPVGGQTGDGAATTHARLSVARACRRANGDGHGRVEAQDPGVAQSLEGSRRRPERNRGMARCESLHSLSLPCSASLLTAH